VKNPLGGELISVQSSAVSDKGFVRYEYDDSYFFHVPNDEPCAAVCES
jgi:hypothetical protein